MKITSATVIFVDTTTLVLKIDDGSQVLKLSIGRYERLKEKACMEYLTSPLDGVVGVNAIRFCEKGLECSSLFEKPEQYTQFVTSYRKDELNRCMVNDMLQRMRKQPTLLLKQDRMDGSLEDLPLCERSKLKCHLVSLFYSVFQKQALLHFNHYVIHGDLYSRNILYKKGNNSIDLKITDFGKSSFTNNKEQLKHSVQKAIQNITESHGSSKRPLAPTEMGRLRSRRRFN
jgi:serine/threonine protein kinase